MVIKKVTLLMALLLSSLGINAQGNSHWQCDIYEYEYDMAVYFQLFKHNVVITDYSDYEIAAFVGDKCRGIADILSNSSGEQSGYIRIHSNVKSGETVTFKVYQRSTGMTTSVEESVAFVNLALEGMPSTPIALHLQLNTTILPGDVNGDGNINEVDAQLILDVSVGQKSLSDLAVPEAIDVPGGNSEAYEVNAQIVLDYSVAAVKPW